MMWLVDIGEQFWLNPDPNVPNKGLGISQQPSSGLCFFVSGAPVRIPCKSCFDSIGRLISCILPNIYVFAGVILFILMIIGGIGVIRGAGSGNEEDLKKGQKAITSALLGFLIIFVSYWIIQLVQIITGTEIFNNPSL